MSYNLVLFDFDGTLADSFPWFLKTINQLADKHGFKRIVQHEVEALRHLSSRDLMAHLGMPLWKLPAVTGDMRRLMTENAAAIPLFDGVRSMLERLAASGITLGVVTSNTEANVRAILGDTYVPLVRHFECGASMFGKKAKFRKLVKAAGVAPGRILCVGDEIRDAQAASEAGLDFAAVGWGYTNPDALAPYSCAAPFANAGELAEWLLERLES
ncbi:MAG TPA: HAD hydrolase-like protein [Noviherbaspirillum sp.]|nr:HAD hydrolase-like protein [Noviherbaspirillum sp.]